MCVRVHGVCVCVCKVLKATLRTLDLYSMHNKKQPEGLGHSGDRIRF